MTYKPLFPDSFRPLTEPELQLLEESIRTTGRVLQEILVDETGGLIDGFHRQAIAEKLNLPCPVRICTGLSPGQKRALCEQINLAKGRQLTPEQRKKRTRELSEKGMSTRQIAKVLKVDPMTVVRDLHSNPSAVEFSTADASDKQSLRRIASNGKSYPARKRTPDEMVEHKKRVLELKAEGLTNAEIGKQLGISPSAVSAVTRWEPPRERRRRRRQQQLAPPLLPAPPEVISPTDSFGLSLTALRETLERLVDLSPPEACANWPEGLRKDFAMQLRILAQSASDRADILSNPKGVLS